MAALQELYPKQLINLTGNLSLLQTTLKRVAELPDVLPPILVIGEEHRFMTKSQIQELALFPDFHLLLEPLGRNTAPAICGAALYGRQQFDGENPVLLVLPADHLIRKADAFVDVVRKAADLAARDRLVTFGIVPDRPETGYGYICRGENDTVASFVEKPDLETAEQYVASGNYFWNSGMFAFTVDSFCPNWISTPRRWWHA